MRLLGIPEQPELQETPQPNHKAARSRDTYVICMWGYISFISRNIDKKQLAEAEVAETEAG